MHAAAGGHAPYISLRVDHEADTGMLEFFFGVSFSAFIMYCRFIVIALDPLYSNKALTVHNATNCVQR